MESKTQNMKQNSKSNFYVIIGPDTDSGEQQYWGCHLWEWTPEFDQASHYHNGYVFFMPLPPGAQGVMEFTEENEPIRWYEPDSTPPYWVSPFAV
jgi:hypothetical protein